MNRSAHVSCTGLPLPHGSNMTARVTSFIFAGFSVKSHEALSPPQRPTRSSPLGGVPHGVPACDWRTAAATDRISESTKMYILPTSCLTCILLQLDILAAIMDVLITIKQLVFPRTGIHGLRHAARARKMRERVTWC